MLQREMEEYYILKNHVLEFIVCWFLKLLNPLLPKSDKQISPNSITPKSNIKFMRIREIIRNSRSSWLLNKFSLQAP